MYSKFYSYVGSISKESDWARGLSSLDAKDANLGALLQKSDQEDFLAASSKTIVVELVTDAGTDVSAVQYFYWRSALLSIGIFPVPYWSPVEKTITAGILRCLMKTISA